MATLCACSHDPDCCCDELAVPRVDSACHASCRLRSLEIGAFYLRSRALLMGTAQLILDLAVAFILTRNFCNGLSGEFSNRHMAKYQPPLPAYSPSFFR